jgi:hypothetical protein
MSLETIEPEEVEENDVRLTPNFVPNMEQEVPVATYIDWKKEDTHVVTFQVGSAGQGTIRNTVGHCATRSQAETECTKRFGRILEANYVPGRAFFRVMKPAEGAQ